MNLQSDEATPVKDFVWNVMGWLLAVFIVGGIGFGIWTFMGSINEQGADNRCSKIAWRVAKDAGLEAGEASYKACRQAY